MIDEVEKDFFIIVEECSGTNSYWLLNTLFDVDDQEPFGFIEIGDEQCLFEKIVSLAHEVGHLLLDRNEYFRDYKEVIFQEAIAWFLGYEYFVEKGWIIEIEEYKDRASQALDSYIRSLL